MTKTKPIYQQKTDETMISLGFDPRTGKPASEERIRELRSKLGDNKRKSPNSSYSSPNNPKTTINNPPFRIPALEKTRRQSPNGLAYKHSAVYRNAAILRLLTKKFTQGLDPRKHHRLIDQMDSSARSVVANIREGYLRPTSKEYSIFLGFSHGSLEELKGDFEDCRDDGLLKSKPGTGLEGIGIILKPPPKSSYGSPKTSFDPLGEIKRQVRAVKRHELTYEIFLELVNKTDYLIKNTVKGIDDKIIKDEKQKLYAGLASHWRKEW